MATKSKQGLDMFTVAPGVFGLRDSFVNMYMIADHTAANWVLVDTGLKWSASKIRKMAAMIFGAHSRPEYILLTHGHFDHVGSVKQLAEEWDVPVYAHFLERPYLAGKSSYPPPDPSVGGGAMASLSFLYPRGPINIADRLQILPEDGTVPELPEWRYIHTPGHTPGHISLWREKDRLLLPADAFVTTRQESAWAVMRQKPELNGPPKYYTTDWEAAARSVQRLANLEPEVVAAGHGKPMAGPGMLDDLHALVRHFAEKARPGTGRYVREPAISNEDGVLYVPPRPKNKTAGYLALAAVTALAIWMLARKGRRSPAEPANA